MTNKEIKDQLTLAMLKLKQLEINTSKSINEIGATLAKLSKSYDEGSK